MFNKLNKNGNIFSLFAIIVILLGVAILAVLFLNMSHRVTSTVSRIDAIKTTPLASQANSNVQNMQVPIGESLIFFIFLAGVIGLIIAAVYTNFSPTIIFVFILISLIGIFAASLAANIYHGISTDSGVLETTSHMSITNILFSKYTPLIVGALAVIVIIIMYSKSGDNIS